MADTNVKQIESCPLQQGPSEETERLKLHASSSTRRLSGDRDRLAYLHRLYGGVDTAKINLFPTWIDSALSQYDQRTQSYWIFLSRYLETLSRACSCSAAGPTPPEVVD